MNSPKFKKPKWNVSKCLDCNRFMKEQNNHFCVSKGHKVFQIPNVPFLLKNLSFDSFIKTYSGTSIAKVKADISHEIGMAEFSKIVPFMIAGEINDKIWYAWTSSGGTLRLKVLSVPK